MNNQDVVYIKNNEIVSIIKKTIDKDQRRQIIRNHLFNSLNGKTLTKRIGNLQMSIKNTRTDIKHLTHNEHLDTTLALTQVEEMIAKSLYLGEKQVDTKKELKCPNDYYWYLKITVIIDNKTYDYILNIARNKTDKHISLYDITNYNKKNADSYRISNAGNNTLFSINNLSKDESKVK